MAASSTRDLRPLFAAKPPCYCHTYQLGPCTGSMLCEKYERIRDRIGQMLATQGLSTGVELVKEALYPPADQRRYPRYYPAVDMDPQNIEQCLLIYPVLPRSGTVDYDLPFEREGPRWQRYAHQTAILRLLERIGERTLHVQRLESYLVNNGIYNLNDSRECGDLGHMLLLEAVKHTSLDAFEVLVWRASKLHLCYALAYTVLCQSRERANAVLKCVMRWQPSIAIYFSLASYNAIPDEDIRPHVTTGYKPWPDWYRSSERNCAYIFTSWVARELASQWNPERAARLQKLWPVPPADCLLNQTIDPQANGSASTGQRVYEQCFEPGCSHGGSAHSHCFSNNFTRSKIQRRLFRGGEAKSYRSGIDLSEGKIYFRRVQIDTPMPPEDENEDQDAPRMADGDAPPKGDEDAPHDEDQDASHESEDEGEDVPHKNEHVKTTRPQYSGKTIWPGQTEEEAAHFAEGGPLHYLTVRRANLVNSLRADKRRKAQERRHREPVPSDEGEGEVEDGDDLQAGNDEEDGDDIDDDSDDSDFKGSNRTARHRKNATTNRNVSTPKDRKPKVQAEGDSGLERNQARLKHGHKARGRPRTNQPVKQEPEQSGSQSMTPEQLSMNEDAAPSTDRKKKIPRDGVEYTTEDGITGTTGASRNQQRVIKRGRPAGAKNRSKSQIRRDREEKGRLRAAKADVRKRKREGSFDQPQTSQSGSEEAAGPDGIAGPSSQTPRVMASDSEERLQMSNTSGDDGDPSAATVSRLAGSPSDNLLTTSLAPFDADHDTTTPTPAQRPGTVSP